MIRHQPRLGELRFSARSSDEAMPAYKGCCNVMWESPTTVWLSMLRADDLRRSEMRELVAWLVEHGVTIVKAHRAPGHRLPFFRPVESHLQMVVAEAAAYALRMPSV